MTGTLLFTTAQSNLMREQVQTLSRLQAGNPDPGLTQGSDK